MLTIAATSADAIAEIEAKLAAALPQAKIKCGRTLLFFSEVREGRAIELHKCQGVVQIPGLTGTEVRDALEAVAPQLGVTLGTVLKKPHDPVEVVSYNAEGVNDWADAPQDS